jgi:hypothetical protein
LAADGSSTRSIAKEVGVNKRHGTTTLFAALEVATGKALAAHSKRGRRVEFLGFMNSVVAAFPKRIARQSGWSTVKYPGSG